ncbi:MAG: MoaD/ThiS family protein [Myxococcota bacterium]
MPLVRIPAPYRGPTRGAESVDVEGSTVRACVQAVADAFPGFGEQVFDAAGDVHRFVTLFVNGVEVDRGAIDQSIEASDEVEVLAAIAGG